MKSSSGKSHVIIISSECLVTNIKAYSNHYTGFLYAILSALFLSFSNVLIKKSTMFNGSEQAVIRYSFQLGIMVVIAIITKNNLLGPVESRKILVIRGLLGMIYLLSLHFSVKLIAPSDSVSLVHMNIVIVAILARVFLSEQINLAHVVSLIFAIFGIVLIAQPSFLFNKIVENNNLTLANGLEYEFLSNDMKKIAGISLALLSSSAIAFQSIILKKLSNKKVHYSVSIVYGCYFGLPISFVLSVVMFLFNNNISVIGKQIVSSGSSELTLQVVIFQCLFSFISAICGVVSQILMNLALNHEDASKVSMLRSTELFFTFLLQYLILAIIPNLFSICGAILIIVGTFFILIYKLVDKKQAEFNSDNRISCLPYLKKLLLFKF